MPILTPGGVPIFLISDLVSEVIIKAENKTTDTDRAATWIRDALLEVTSDPDFRNEFDQLEVYGPYYNLTAQQQEYDGTNLIPSGDVNVATLDILIWQDYPTNTIRRKLSSSHYQKVDNFQPVYSLPTEWYRFGDLIGFNPVPDQPYQVIARMLRQHPIADTLTDTEILIPRDWNEILVWMAVQRGFMEYLEYEKAQKIYTLLHGDPKYPNRPGLYNGRKKRREMEANRTSKSLPVRMRKYGYGG